MTSDQNSTTDADREVALITGGGGGIGREIALRLGASGTAVAVFDLSLDTAQETADQVAASGGDAVAAAVDVTDRASVVSALQAAEGELGPLTIAVSSHGIGPGTAFLDLTEDTWNSVLSVNLTGCLIVGQEAGRRLARREYGRMVNISSVSAHFPSSGIAAYMVSKGGVEALTRAMAFELGPHGVTVNSVSPGPIMTQLMMDMLSDEGRSARVERMPVGHLGKPADVAAAVSYLVSRDAGYISGSVVTVDGGYSIAGIRAPDTSEESS
jgi:NAD(P)-dependent dehydrogenase (short-subunit alcohol dehydrogenase family)